MFSADVNVVLVNNVRPIFNGLKRKRKAGPYNTSPYTNLLETTTRFIRRNSSRVTHQNISPPKAPDFDVDLKLPSLQPLVEVCKSLTISFSFFFQLNIYMYISLETDKTKFFM